MSAKDLEKDLGDKMLNLASAPWKMSDETLFPAAGACTTCQKRTSCAPDLFSAVTEDAEITVPKNDRCLDGKCWGDKQVAYNKIKIDQYRSEYPNLIIVEKVGSRLPQDHPWKKELKEIWRYKGAPKSEEGTIPAYIAGGPGAGRIEWVKSQYEDKRERPRNKDGKAIPKSVEVKRQALMKKRIIRFINKLMIILEGKDPDITGAKSGICRICGRDETEGDSIIWTDVSKTLCSRCNDVDGYEVDERRMRLVPNGIVEVFSLVAAFGAHPLRFIFSKNGEDGESATTHQEIFNKISNVGDLPGPMQYAAFGVFDMMVEVLRQKTYVETPSTDLPDFICEVLKLNRNEIWEKVEEELPEPRTWRKAEKKEAEEVQKEDSTVEETE